MGAPSKKDPIRELLADIQPALFLGNPSGTVAIMKDKVVEAGGDPDKVLEWVREHGGYPDKSFGVAHGRDSTCGPSQRASTTTWCPRTR